MCRLSHTLNNPVKSFKVLINGLLMACVGAAILTLDRDRKLLNVDIWTQHVNKWEQRIIPEKKRNYLVKILSWMAYNHIILSKKEP